ncbi:MAG: hypothetical protein IPJ94_11760 [Chloroflexi bacterium]|nr:hypothetical protein [Chloroflexota bacterium]
MNDFNQKYSGFGRLSAGIVLLAAFGLLFDRFTGWFGRQEWGEQRSAFLVAFGVAITLLLRRWLLPVAWFWDFVAFCVSGLPMIVGRHLRYERRRKAAIHRHVQRRR